MDSHKKLNILVDMLKTELQIINKDKGESIKEDVELVKKDKKPRKTSEWSKFQKQASAELQKEGITRSLKNITERANVLAEKAGYMKKNKSKSKVANKDIKNEDIDATLIKPY